VTPCGWWRRNRWGLVAVLPAFAAILSLHFSDAYEQYWLRQPNEPVAAAEQGWASYGGAQMRLVELGPAGDLKDYGGKPVQLPPSVRAWRAVIEFRVSSADAVAGCRLSLEDDTARVYDVGPAELSRARTPIPTCTAPAGSQPSADYQSVVYFVTAADTLRVDPVDRGLMRLAAGPEPQRRRCGQEGHRQPRVPLKPGATCSYPASRTTARADQRGEPWSWSSTTSVRS
jgi:hypothetical protein